jgi:rod shape-determining protein MreD
VTGLGLKWFGGIALCLVLQTTIMRVIAIAGIEPDLLLLVLCILGIRAGIMPGIYIGFLIGLGQDLYSPSILGQHALSMTVAGAFLGLFNEKVMRTDPIIKLAIILIAFFIHDSIFTTVTVIKTDASAALFVREILTRTLPRALYSIAFASLLYLVNYYVKPSRRR